VALKLGEYRKLAPTPLEETIFFDHPSGRSRILVAMRWKAAQLAAAPPAPLAAEPLPAAAEPIATGESSAAGSSR
jgi:STE24 endopeptidase